MIPVCLNTFLLIINVSRHRLNRLAKLAYEDKPVIENRDGFHRKITFEAQKKAVSDFLNKLEYSEGPLLPQ